MNSEFVVKEVPGFYGSFKIEESFLQHIWVEQDFFTDSLQTGCKKNIKVVDQGDWNHSEEGPDFKNARLLINGELVTGDIEIHLQPNDWKKHGHHLDSNYNNVVLHVCFFESLLPGQFDAQTRENKCPVPVLILLPYLYCSLEEYAEAYTVAQLAGVDTLSEKKLEKLANLSCGEIKGNILKRWQAKISFANARLSSQRWTDACHQWFLEVLGYRRNRAAMARISQSFPIDEWKTERIDPQHVFLCEKNWKLRGCRPANHPLARIVQYAKLCRDNPGWMSDLEMISSELKGREEGWSINRKEILELSKYWKCSVLRDIFAQGKANTLWIDFALPLLSARYQINGYELWENWPSGDCPNSYRQWAKMVGWTDRKMKKSFTNGLVQCMVEAFSR